MIVIRRCDALADDAIHCSATCAHSCMVVLSHVNCVRACFHLLITLDPERAPIQTPTHHRIDLAVLLIHTTF
jgi:hypothetical protein